MSGNLSIRDKVTTTRPSQGAWPFETCGAAVYGEPSWAVLPLSLYEKATTGLRESLNEAEEEDIPSPSGEAVRRAEHAISFIIQLLMSQLAENKVPVVAAVVTYQGGIEVVGYYHGVLGRHTARIDKDGTCVRVTTTMPS